MLSWTGVGFQYFRPARTSCTTSDGLVHPPASVKNLDLLYTVIYALQIIRRFIKNNRMTTWDPPDIPLDYSQGNPFGPLNAPLDPFEDPSNVAVDPMEHLNIWDPEGLPLDPLGPCRPTPLPPVNL